MLLKWLGHIWRYIFELFLTFFSILMIIAFSKSYFYFPSLQGVQVFWQNLKILLSSFIYINDIKVQINEYHSQPLLSAMIEPYIYSLVVLSSALSISFIIAVIFVFFYFMANKKIQFLIRGSVFFVQSIPDVVFVFSIQLFVIWFYKKTDLLVVNPVAGFENVYLLPILTASILPSIMLFQMLILSFRDEDEKPYSEFAQAKGLSRYNVLVRHIFRNTLVSLFSSTQYLFWFLLSNLLVIEYLFNMDGFFQFLYKLRFTSEVLAIGLTFLFLPFYIIDAVGQKLVIFLTGGGRTSL